MAMTDDYSDYDMDEQYELAYAAGRASRNEEIAQLEVENKRLREVLVDLVSCMTGVIEGDYTPDSFTLQPAREVLADSGILDGSNRTTGGWIGQP